MIYIDCTECIPKGSIRFHGGANYGKRAVQLLSRAGKHVTVLLQKDSHSEMDERFYSELNAKVIYIDDLQAFEGGASDDILFIPMIPTRRLSIIKKLQINNVGMKVYVTIHGVRKMDLRPDVMDHYYTYARIRYLRHFFSIIKYRFGCVAYKRLFSEYIPCFDKVFTDSNDSMQKIQRICSPRYIKYFYLGSINSDFDVYTAHSQGYYFLVVSGGRPEKNLLRTLLAFQQFVEETNSEFKLIVTGISDEIRNNILCCPRFNQSLISEHVVFKPYVDAAELRELYINCKCVLYLSKSEGFGLPLVEAALYEKPIITSSITAMPEVLASGAYYANPYDVNSICRSMIDFCNIDEDYINNQSQRTRKLVIDKINNADKDFLLEFV